MKRASYACGTSAHHLARRRFLGQLAGAGALSVAGGLGWFAQPAVAAEAARQGKRMLVINMAGGLSQLESWDPKPGVSTGGPFRAIPTSVPGIHISELLPHTARVMHHLCLIRGINTHEDDHGKGAHIMLTGMQKTPAAEYPELGAVMSKALDPGSSALPGHIKISPGGGGGRSADSAYLGPAYASVVLGNGNPPQHTSLPGDLPADRCAAMNAFRCQADASFLERRRTAMTDAWAQSFEQAQELMRQREIFDVTRESDSDRERYGTHDFGRHCLLARRLLEKGITFVQVTHSNYDTHNENFSFHFEQLGEFDRSFAALVADIADRGMLDDTLIVVLSEFGRTPNINHLYGRDHWSKAWSVCAGGAGLVRGAAYGKTGANGTEVTEHEVSGGALFHTWLRAAGIKSSNSFNIGGRRFPMADPAEHAIDDILA